MVTLTLQNLEGSLGSQAWGLQGVFLSNLALDGQPITAHVFDSSAPAFEGTAQDHGVPTAILNGFWLWNTTAASTASFDRETQLGDGGYPIAGCSPSRPTRDSGRITARSGTSRPAATAQSSTVS